MIKIAISSDNHLDINSQDLDKVIQVQNDFFLEKQIDYYFFAGDLSNDFLKTLNFFEKMQSQTKTKVFFLAGNHDMGRSISYDELETDISPLYFHNKMIEIGNYQIFGNNGWYDYSFVLSDYSIEEIEQFKKALWFDRIIKQNGISDEQRLKRNAEQFQNSIISNADINKKKILITHFLPNSYQIKRFKEKKKWDLVNAFMGSNSLGDLAIANDFQFVFYGHMHINDSFTIQKTIFENISVGQKQELGNLDFLTSWKSKLKIIDIF